MTSPADMPPAGSNPKDTEDPSAWISQLRAGKEGYVFPSFGNLCLILENTIGSRLSYNEMSTAPFIDGAPMEDHHIANIRCDLEREWDTEFAVEKVRDAILMIAHKRSFHPVKQYLRGLQWDGIERISRVGPELLGVPESDVLARDQLRRFFIGATARALNPGVKFDTVLVLFGKQGYKKSTFFDVLGGDWYCDSRLDLGDRRGVITLHSTWIQEWSEVDQVMARKLNSEFKAFVSERYDTFIPIYGRAAVKAARSCAIGATSNEQQFLTDATGSRRWWVVKVCKKINAKVLKAWRDQLWAEAVYLYDRFIEQQIADVDDDANPFRWWLDDEEDAAREERAEQHNIVDAWEEIVGTWLHDGRKIATAPKFSVDDQTKRRYVTQVDVLVECLKVDKERLSSLSHRLAAVLSKLGWSPPEDGHRPRRNGQKVTAYLMPTDWKLHNAETKAVKDAADEALNGIDRGKSAPECVKAIENEVRVSDNPPRKPR